MSLGSELKRARKMEDIDEHEAQRLGLVLDLVESNIKGLTAKAKTLRVKLEKLDRKLARLEGAELRSQVKFELLD